MAKQITGVDANIYQYMLDSGLRERDILTRLREETNRLAGVAAMQISPDQGQFMALLANAIGARRILEIGCFTGYSALVLAYAIAGGDQQADAAHAKSQIVTCDVSEEWTAIARHYWAEAGMAQWIDLRLGPALDSLQAMIDKNEDKFDMAFIDADKVNLQNYYEYCLRLLRPGALILVDNVLWGGDVMDSEKVDDDTSAIREFNRLLQADERVDIAMLAIGDGLSLARIR